MKYKILHESSRRIRVQLSIGKISPSTEAALYDAFRDIPGIRKTVIYTATGRAAFTHSGDRAALLAWLDAFSADGLTDLTGLTELIDLIPEDFSGETDANGSDGSTGASGSGNTAHSSGHTSYGADVGRKTSRKWKHPHEKVVHPDPEYHRELKCRLRRKIVLESIIDLVMPMPVQIAYHVYQFIALRDV